MMRLLKALPALFRQSLQVMFQYRGEIVLWALWGIVYPLVAMSVMTAAIDGTDSGTNIRGYTEPDIAAYFLITMVVGHFCAAWDVFEMGYLVRSGTMSPRLLRPILPMWQSVSDNTAYKVLTLTILIPIWFGVAWVVKPAFDTTLTSLSIGVFSSVLAAFTQYLWGYNLALLAFWMTRTDAVSEVWWGMNLFFGGRLFPLDLLPEPLQVIAAALPFKWIIWFPTSALIGHLNMHEMLTGLCWQVGWLSLGVVVFRYGWRRAVRAYTAVGN